jgi:hypothetical protein
MPDTPRIADLAEVTAAETVVRLDEGAGRLDDLVLTGDVSRSLGAVLDAARGPSGAAFLVVGHFGSGKSHFLAALGELLADPRRAASLGGAWDARLREQAAAARPSLPVTVPLVEYRASSPLEDVVWQRAWAAVGRPAPASSSSRAGDWSRLLAAATEAGQAGLLLLVDELSEFLRAKQGPPLTEDLRFLQFLGEWARERPVVVLGALQESIEEVANVSLKELARIRDRYGTLGLSMRHVEDLVRGRLVRLRPGAEDVVERAHRELRAAFPRWRVTLDRFLACYPIHPETLALLGGLRFLLSQQRGVVDFICRQLRGDPAAGLVAWQERPYRDLVTPDRVYDHFRARLHERVESNRLADTVVPYYERTAPLLFDTEDDRAVALRAVKLLALVSASPVERRRTGPELAEMLLAQVSALDPEANYGYFEQAILEVLAGHGAYVVARHERGGTATYAVELDADASVVAAARAGQVRAELQPGDRRVVEELVGQGGSQALPLALLKQTGTSRREVIWQNTPRHVLVAVARLPEVSGDEVAAWTRALETTGAEVCVVVAELELEPEAAAARSAEADALVEASPRLAVWVPDRLTAEEADFAVDLYCRRAVLARARREGGGPAGLAEYLERSTAADVARAREVVARAYFQGRLVSAGGTSADLPSLSGLPFDRLLRALVGPVLVALHPRHQEVQPLDELVGDRLVRQLAEGVLGSPRLTLAAADRERLRRPIENVLVPLGAVRRRGDAFHVAPDPARSPAVAELLRLTAGAGPARTADVAAELARGPVGLTEFETLLLLNAAVQSGLLEARRRGRPVAAPFLSLAEVETLGMGELLAPELRARVAELGSLFGPGPFEPWNARLQQSCWEHARAWLEARAEDAAQARELLARLAESPALADADPGAAAADLELLSAVVRAGEPQAQPREGLERLLDAIGEPEELRAAVGRAAALARFARSELAGFVAAVEYVAHPDLVVPETDEHARLAALRADTLGLARQVVPLAADDRAREALAALQQFRRAYLAAYEEAHAAYHAAAGPAARMAVTASPEYRALAALSELGASAVPDDRVKVDRALEGTGQAPCARRVELELQWRPICSCGFQIGDRPRTLDPAALVATASRGVAQHLAEVAGPEHRGRLERAAEDLAALGREESAADLRRFLTLAAAPATADPVAIAHLLQGPLRETLHDVLGGGRLVVRRDLARLREDLIGRRYPRRRLLELLAEWVGQGPDVPEGAFVEVVDSGEREAGAGPPPAAGGATAALLRRRFPGLAAALPAERPADAFWLAAWWLAPAGGPGPRPAPPAWVPPGLLAEPEAVAAACRAALADPGARAELAELDARVGPQALLGDQVGAALSPAGRTAAEVAVELFGERLLRHPVRLAAGELVRRVAADFQLADRLPPDGLARLRAGHALLEAAELAPLQDLLDAARHLAALERRLADADCRALVEQLYPACWAPVPDLLSRAQLAAARGSVLEVDSVEPFRSAARRLLRAAEARFAEAAAAGFPGCLRIWEVGEAVLAPLLEAHGRVAVLVVDAMRADLWLRLRDRFQEELRGRGLVERWAVVPEPTRTAEAMAALGAGRPVAAGEAPAGTTPPFAHLGHESRLLGAADRDFRWVELLELWAEGPPVSVAVATGVDERLHRTPVELTGLLDEAVAGLARRVLPSLRALPAEVPLVVMADHGFREDPGWGRGREGRYVHGGLSLEECVVPVAVLA